MHEAKKGKLYFSILTGIVFCFAILSVASLSYNIYQYFVINKSTEAVQTLYNKHLQGINFLRKSKSNLLTVNNALLELISDTSNSNGKNLYQTLNSIVSELNDNLDIAAERATHPLAVKNIGAAIKTIEDNLNIEFSPTKMQNYSTLQAKTKEITLLIEDAIEFESNKAYDYLISQEETQAKVVHHLKIGFMFICILLLGIPIYLYFSLIKPIRNLRDQMHKFGKGEIKPENISNINVENEISELNDTFKKMAQQIIENERTIYLNSLKYAEAARQAGMFEIASEMMHNIGNLLNSLYTSVDFLCQKTKNSIMVRKIKAINGAIDGLLDNMKENPEIAKEFFKKMEQECVKENISINEEINYIKKSLSHIHNLVQKSKDNNQFVDINEELNLNNIVKDCIKISQSNKKADVTINTDLQPLPNIKTNRHSVVQILVNIITNAIHATEANDKQTSNQITLKTIADSKSITISVEDNGIGFKPDAKNNLFKQGFTTKDSGQGLGLHNTANLIQRLGGSIHAQSKGEFQGAIFKVEIPLNNGKNNNPDD